MTPNKHFLDRLEKETYFKLECFPELDRIEGNASAIDPQTDKNTVEWIRSELESGNVWAWCRVKVTAYLGFNFFKDFQGFEGIDWLGCCSYKSEEDFRASDYFKNMKNEALASLADEFLKHKIELDNFINGLLADE